MADTKRTLGAILALLPDNTSGDISPQDARDAFVTLAPSFGNMAVTVGNGAAVTIPDTTGYHEVTAPTWTLGSSSAEWTMGTNGRLQYDGAETVAYVVVATLTFSCAVTAQFMHFRVGKTGTSQAQSELHRTYRLNGDDQSVCLVCAGTIAPTDYISLFIKNTTATNNVTVDLAQVAALALPI